MDGSVTPQFVPPTFLDWTFRCSRHTCQMCENKNTQQTAALLTPSRDKSNQSCSTSARVRPQSKSTPAHPRFHQWLRPDCGTSAEPLLLSNVPTEPDIRFVKAAAKWGVKRWMGPDPSDRNRKWRKNNDTAGMHLWEQHMIASGKQRMRAHFQQSRKQKSQLNKIRPSRALRESSRIHSALVIFTSIISCSAVWALPLTLWPFCSRRCRKTTQDTSKPVGQRNYTHSTSCLS